MEIRDQFHDPAYATLYHLLQENPQAADFVKHAELNEDQIGTLPASAFAWPDKRLFPINTAENTVLSQLYREKCAAVPVEVDEALNKALEIYGVKPLVTRTKVAATPPPISDDEYLLPSVHRLRVKTAEDVKVAEKLLLEQYPKLSITDRAEGFINLVKRARDLNVSLEPETHRMAGMTVCSTKIAMDFIEARRCATKEPLFQRAYEKLAGAFARNEIRDRDELIAACDTLAKLDKMAGLEKHYDRDLPDPIRTVFNTTEKIAEDNVDLAGRLVSMQKLATLPSSFWGDVMGPEMLKEITDKRGEVDVTKLGQVLPTLPLDLKLILKHQVP
jgi:hypothetical protein